MIEPVNEVSLGLLEERYRSLRSHVPIIYLVVLVCLCGLQLTTTGTIAFGINLPSTAFVLAIVRITAWRRQKREVSHEQMRKALRQSSLITGALCVAVLIWCIQLSNAHSGSDAYILLFASLIAIGAANGLNCVPSTATLPLLVLALPIAALAMATSDGRLIGAATALTCVALLMLKQLRDHSRQFEALVNSRTAFLIEQKRAEQSHAEATRASKTDFLTGLPNRRALIETLQARAESADTRCAVAILDLDHFKPVNDTLGHSAGDDLLRIIGGRLLESERGRSLVARLGGDEFAVVLENAGSEEDVQRWATALVGKIAEPAVVQDRTLNMTASCGLMLLDSGCSESVRSMLSSADMALYHAKDQPPPRVAIYDANAETPRLRRIEVERALRSASPNEISIVYQPIVDLHSHQIIALEALARWQSSALGEVGPSEFIPAAERLHLIEALNDQLLRRSLRETERFHPQVRLAFNLSAVQLADKEAAADVLKAVSVIGVPNSRLQVEVTETALLSDFATARKNLNELRAQGILIALDDFGAGYSSISYLREIQFDQIKVDGSYVTSDHPGQDRLKLLGAVIGLCRALDIEPIAEHIETEEQLKSFQDLGCQYGQGFYLCKPEDASAFHKRLTL